MFLLFSTVKQQQFAGHGAMDSSMVRLVCKIKKSLISFLLNDSFRIEHLIDKVLKS